MALVALCPPKGCDSHRVVNKRFLGQTSRALLELCVEAQRLQIPDLSSRDPVQSHENHQLLHCVPRVGEYLERKCGTCSPKGITSVSHCPLGPWWVSSVSATKVRTHLRT